MRRALDALLSLFPSGRRRPSVRALLGGIASTLMSLEASVIRIEQQNSLIVDALIDTLATQRAQADALKRLAEAAPAGADPAMLAALDEALAATDAKLAALARPASGPAVAGGTAGTSTADETAAGAGPAAA